jgi:arabinose-5-phosphate isomerase
MQKEQDFCHLGLAVIELEAQAISNLSTRIGENFNKACQHMLNCEGRIVVLGMGKSGHIGGKIAATLASTGSPAFFVHPGEASHGDLGMITKKDVVLALSYSGETPEILTILPFIKRLGIPFISLTGNPQSSIAQTADVHIDISIEKEACPLGLAPTSSAAATLVMGDALAIALLQARGFTSEDFALSHPGGKLGRRLLLRIDDIMHRGDRIPLVNDSVTISEALIEMTRKRMGVTGIIDENNHLIGIYTDGDVRRTLDKQLNIQTTNIKTVMTPNSKTITVGLLAVEALNIMETYKISNLFVVDDACHPIGALHLLDLLNAGVA